MKLGFLKAISAKIIYLYNKLFKSKKKYRISLLQYVCCAKQDVVLKEK